MNLWIPQRTVSFPVLIFLNILQLHSSERIKLFFLFENDDLKEVIVLRSDVVQHLKEIIEQHQPHHSILSSVINHDEAIESFLQRTTQFHKLTHLSKLPFTIPVGKPETMGTDRMAI